MFSPDKQARYCRDTRRVFMGNAPTLGTLRLAFGERVAVGWIEIQLRDLSEFCGARVKETLPQREAIASVMLSQFHFLKATELMYFFLLFKSGKYGVFYGVVDGLMITDALRTFCDMRERLITQYEDEDNAERTRRESADMRKNAMTYEEWDELKWLFNMGYEPWRIKKELAEQRRSAHKKEQANGNVDG